MVEEEDKEELAASSQNKDDDVDRYLTATVEEGPDEPGFKTGYSDLD